MSSKKTKFHKKCTEIRISGDISAKQDIFYIIQLNNFSTYRRNKSRIAIPFRSDKIVPKILLKFCKIKLYFVNSDF
jgi:hypothetical protein